MLIGFRLNFQMSKFDYKQLTISLLRKLEIENINDRLFYYKIVNIFIIWLMPHTTMTTICMDYRCFL